MTDRSFIIKLVCKQVKPASVCRVLLCCSLYPIAYSRIQPSVSPFIVVPHIAYVSAYTYTLREQATTPHSLYMCFPAVGELATFSVGVCQAGTSVAIADDPNSDEPAMAVGGPGVFNWRGT